MTAPATAPKWSHLTPTYRDEMACAVDKLNALSTPLGRDYAGLRGQCPSAAPFGEAAGVSVETLGTLRRLRPTCRWSWRTVAPRGDCQMGMDSETRAPADVDSDK